MYIPYFNAIKTLFKTHLNDFKTIDWYNDQYSRYKDLKAVVLPAVYIEFDDTVNWQDAGNKLQLADTTIKLHIVQFYVGDSPEIVMHLAQKTHKVLQGKSLVYEEQKLSTALTRTASSLISEYDQLKIMTLSYSTALFDASAMPCYTKIPVKLNVKRGF